MYILLFGDGNMLFFEDLALFTFKVHLCLHALVVLLSKSDACSTVLAILFENGRLTMSFAQFYHTSFGGEEQAKLYF